MIITKANGQREPFDEHKLRRSIRRAHIPQQYHDQVIEEVRDSLYEGIPTYEIYQHVNTFFSRQYPQGSCMYNLKQAIMDLGPSGYPFERYIGKLLEHQGYKTRVSTTIPGKCVTHEVDVIAEKNHEHFMIECKFHNQHGLRSDVKVALYVYARYLDVLSSWTAREPVFERNTKHQAWIITNTKFSSDALQYGQCVGMKMVGWNYPEKSNLQEMVETSGLHPITSLSSLSQSQKQYLLEKDVVLAVDLERNEWLLQELHLPYENERQVRDELKALRECVLA